jgi:phage terminase small subunit
MAREKYELAEEDYINGMKYKDIAQKYNVTLNTVKSWKTRYKWSKDGAPKTKKSMHTKKEKVCTQNKRSASKKEVIADEVKEVLENTELNDKQRLFCVIYAKRMNATKAYQQAYNCSYETAMVNGCNLLRNPKIKEQVDKLTALELNKEVLKRGVIQKYIDIAFSDITDFMKFGKKDEILYNSDGKPILDEDGIPKTKEVSYVELKESNQIDGTLISEISEGATGIKVKLVDKMKALDFLTKHVNLLSDEEKIKLDVENKKLQNEKAKAEINKIKAEIAKNNGPGNNDIPDDGFLQALEGTATEDWADEQDS